MSFLVSQEKKECFGCEACIQSCEYGAIAMAADEEGFRYPQIDPTKCVSCGRCKSVCPYPQRPLKQHKLYTAFGGYHRDPYVRKESTSGGAFPAIANAWCTAEYAIFGATQEGRTVFHTYITDKTEIHRFQKSKYKQSVIGSAYSDAKTFLQNGKKVLFSGTPCQIAALKSYLGDGKWENLLTVEVLCEGIPSPLYLEKYSEFLRSRYGCGIQTLDYRNKDMPRWDFNVMRIELENGKSIYIDRWFNPFFALWIGGFMSRPSCYGCPFVATTGAADLTLADLWGIHIHCPELYDKNKGTSLVLCHTPKGISALASAKEWLLGHELDVSNILSYQKRLRLPIDTNPQREEFMRDLIALDYRSIHRKWVKPPTVSLLWSKYVWGNRQKIFMWNLKQRLCGHSCKGEG